MKAKILVGAIAALIYGNAALAQDQSDTQNQQGQQSPDNFGGSGLDDTNEDLIILDQEDVAPVTPGVDQQGVGGAGDVGVPGQDVGTGGAGQTAPQAKPAIPMQAPGGMTFFCTPVQEEGASGGSGLESGQSALPPSSDINVNVGAVPSTSGEEALGGSGHEEKKEPSANMRGLTVLLGGGIEGYTGGLASRIDPGASAAATMAIRPTRQIGLELGYSGAVNELDADVPGSGPDIVRNGASAALTLGLTASPVQPYVLGGFGMNWYNVNNGEFLGFQDDTSSRIPVGLGLRTHIGSITADARLNYNVLLHEDFAPASVEKGDVTTGSYNGTINIGGTF